MLEHLPFEVRLGETFWSQPGEWIASGTPNTPAIPMRGYRGDGVGLFGAVHGGRTRDNGHKLKQEEFTLGIRRNFFQMRTASKWGRLS